MINSRQELNHQARVLKHNWDTLQDLKFSFCYVRLYNQGQSRDSQAVSSMGLSWSRIRWQSANLIPPDACMATGDGRLVPDIETIRTDCIMVFETSTLVTT